MVTDSGTSTRPDQLRPLNPPRPITVEEHKGMPVALIDQNRRYRVDRIQDVWCIDDEWWREPITRRYFQIVLDTGALRTIYHDLVQNTWHEQGY
jgi:hypothetical protein